MFFLKCADPLRGVTADREQKRQWSQDVLFMTSYNRQQLAAMSLLPLPLLREK